MKWTVFDCEGDGLKPSKFHVLSYQRDNDESPGSLQTYQGMEDCIVSQEVLVGHNIIRWDIPNLERVIGFEVPKETLIVDTLAVAWYLQPKRGVHNLDSYGPDYGYEKPKIDDWVGLTKEEEEIISYFENKK